MYTDISLAMVLWNEAHRIRPLLERVAPFFSAIAVGVQDSTDNTASIVSEFTDLVVTDSFRGFGDATFGPKVLPLVRAPWTLKIDGDEMPTVELLESLGDCVAEIGSKDGAWLRFRSWIEDEEWEAYHSHLRLFRTSLGWPATLHSRPMTEKTIEWSVGWIEHRKSLDEHVRGYLEYLKRSDGNPGWVQHNTEMIWHACVGTARTRGWAHVQAHEWWPEVQATVFKDGIPDPAIPEL